MYIRTGKALSQGLRTSLVPQGMGLGNPIGFSIDVCQFRRTNIDEAVKWNRSQEKKGWKPYIGQIENLLGFTAKPDEINFAWELSYWQCRQNLNTDGKIGWVTWSWMWPHIVAPLLDKYRNDIPLDFLLGWIKAESDGRFAKKPTELGERGYFQIHPDEWGEMGLDKKDFERVSTDPDFSVSAGIQLVKYYAHRAERLGFARGTDPFWRIVKLLHTMGWPKAERLLKDLRKSRVMLDTWKTIRQHIPKWARENVDKVFEQGKQLATKLASP